MKRLLAAAVAAASIVGVTAASAQPMGGYGYGHGQDYNQSANWRGSGSGQPDWGRRDLTGYTAHHGNYGRGGYGYRSRDRDDWRPYQAYGPSSSQSYSDRGVGFGNPFQGAVRGHW